MSRCPTTCAAGPGRGGGAAGPATSALPADPGNDDLVSDRDEPWPLAGQELARLRLGSIADLWPDEARRAARRLPSAGVHACTPSCGGLRLGSGPGQLRSHAGARGEGEDVADGGFLAGGFGQREVRLDLVAVAAAVFLLHHVAGFGEVGDDAETLRSVVPRLAAMSRSLAPGSWALHSSTRA